MSSMCLVLGSSAWKESRVQDAYYEYLKRGREVYYMYVVFHMYVFMFLCLLYLL